MADSQRTTTHGREQKQKVKQDISGHEILQVKEIFGKVFWADLLIKREGHEWKVSLQFLDQAEDLELPSDLLILAY